MAMEQFTTRTRKHVSVILSLVAALTIAGALALVSGSGDVRAQEAAAVSIVDFAFEPGSIEVAAGTTVTWTNNGDAPHTVTADDGAFDSGTIESGGTFSFTFDTPGTYSYFCAIHPTMTATIVVVEGDGGAADDGADEGDDGAPTAMPDTGSGTIALHDSTSLLLALGGAATVLLVLAVRQRRVA